ncbi:hypothetical protein [Nocardia aurea]
MTMVSPADPVVLLEGTKPFHVGCLPVDDEAKPGVPGSGADYR